MLRRLLIPPTLIAVVVGLLAIAAPAHAAPVSPKLQIFVDVWNESPTREYGTFVPVTAQTTATNGFDGVAGSFVVRRNGVQTSSGWTSRGSFSGSLWAEDPAGTYVIEFQFTPDDTATYLPETKSVTIVRPKASQSLDLGSPTTDVRAGDSWTLPDQNPQTARLAVRAGSTAGACAVSGRTVDFTGAGTCTIDVTAEEDANHLAATPRAVTFEVTQAATATDLAWSKDPLLVDEPVDLHISLKSGADPVDGTAEVWLAGQRAATVDVEDGAATWRTSFSSAGRYDVEVRSTPADPGYAPSTRTTSISVVRPAQTISSPPSPAYVGDSWRPTASDGGAVTVTSRTSAVCDVANGQVTFRAAGTCEVDSSAAATATHDGVERSDSFAVVGVPVTAEVTVVPLSAGTQRVELALSSVRGTPTGTVTLNGFQVTTLAGGRASWTTVGRVPGQTLHLEFAYTPTSRSRWAADTIVRDVVIPKVPQTVTIAAPPAAARAGQTWTPTITFASTPMATSWQASGACVREGALVRFTAVGDCTVSATQAGNDDYLPGQAERVVTVQKGLQSISFTNAAPGSAHVGDTWLPRASGGLSGNPIEVSAAPSATCVVADSDQGGTTTPAVRFRAAGECSVTFMQRGSADYEAGDRTVTIPVALVPVTLAVSADDLAVGAEGTITVGATAGGETVPGDVTVEGGPRTLTGAIGNGPAALPVTFARAGDHELAVTFTPAQPATYAAASRSVSVPVARGVQAITLERRSPETALIGDTWRPAVTAGASGEPVATVPSGTCALDGTAIRFTAAGTCTIAFEQAGNADWLAAPTVTTTTEVSLVPVEVTVTAPDDARVGEPTALNVVTTAPGTVEVTVDGQTVRGTGPALPITFTTAGEHEAEVTFAPADPALHRAYSGRTTLTVAKGTQTIRLSDAAPSTRRAGDTWTPVATGGPSGSPVVVEAGPEAVCTVASGTVRFATAGDCEVTITQTGSADYEPAPALRRTVSVERRVPTLAVELPTGARVGEPAVVTASSDEAGTVGFALDGHEVGDPVAVADGTAKVTLVPTAAGERRLTVTFTPDAPGAVTGGQREVTLDVARAETSTAVTVTADALTATVAPTKAAAGVPSGDVAFVVDGVEVGLVPLVAGQAVLPLDTGSDGAIDVRASYAGSDDHEPSTASVVRSNPGITASVASSAPMHAGWYTGAVVVQFTCDAGSAELVEPCPDPVRLDRDGVAAPVTRTVVTRDGGRASVRVDGIRIDTTAPEVEITGARDGATYKAEARAPRCVGSDAVSGLAACDVSQRRIDRWTYDVTATATDVAGNTTTRSLRYRIAHTWLVGVPAGSVIDVTRGSSVRLATLGRSTPTVRTSWGDRPRVRRFTLARGAAPMASRPADPAAGPGRHDLRRAGEDGWRRHPAAAPDRGARRAELSPEGR